MFLFLFLFFFFLVFFGTRQYKTSNKNMSRLERNLSSWFFLFLWGGGGKYKSRVLVTHALVKKELVFIDSWFFMFFFFWGGSCLEGCCCGEPVFSIGLKGTRKGIQPCWGSTFGCHMGGRQNIWVAKATRTLIGFFVHL